MSSRPCLSDGKLRLWGMTKRDRFTVPLKCPKCRQEGTATWEENAPEFLAKGPQSSLEDVSPGFYRRMEKTHRGLTEIICDRCGTTQPG